MEVIIGRILTRHLPWFKEHLKDSTIPHLVHCHSAEMKTKSVIVNLGVFDENPCSTGGAIGIYRKLLNYVPSLNDSPYPTIIFGDGLSCERGNDAQKAVCIGLSPWERLESLHPSPQEFHKEMLLLQDYFDEFFKGMSAAERGTLFNMKNIFNFRQVKWDIRNCFSDAWELMCLSTEDLGMSELDDRPQNAPLNLEQATMEVKRQYLTSVAQTLISKLEYKLDTDALLKMDKEGGGVYCCDQDLDEGFIGCDFGERCAKGQWFYYSCAGINETDLPEEFYCSDECKERINVSYPYCICKTDLGEFEPMVGCDAEDRCTKGKWFHMSCLGIEEEVQEEKGYCSTDCENLMLAKTKKRKRKRRINNEDADYARDYNKAITWRGRDAVREGDGEAMLYYWRLDLANFLANRHPKYDILAYRLLCAVNGWLCQKLQEELIWNRTVNYSGGVGRNLPLDFMNEVLNRLFKDMLEGAKERYTEETIQRCGQLVGPLGEALDNIFEINIVEQELYRHRRRECKRDGNIEKFILMMKNEKPITFAVT
ncbi:hypothetical protein KUTeg_018202 [Tegillarca granosa]|uniref:DUF6589 domain-containing protein n=1 Tax=Tegillarca granosa TaxID=220873 RepID=A0ABQ9EIL8_TEGGR|nr:hypothetical protein KUTeg_018202 [Tegillarca granosa]